MLLRTTLVIALAGIIACGPNTEDEDDLGSEDIRIDMAQAGNDPESGSTNMCLSDDGDLYVIWVDDRGGVPGVWLNRSVDLGLSWMPAAIRVNQGEGSVYGTPALGCTSEGVFVVWEDDRDGELGYHQIYFNRSLDQGLTWEADDILLEYDDPDGLTFSQGPSIAVAGSDVYVAWFDGANGSFDIFVAASNDNGGEWGAPVRVDSDEPAGNAYSAWPQIEATSGGNVYVAWEDSRDGASDIYFARSINAASSFKADTRLDGGDDPGSNYSFSPTLASDGNNVYVAWHDERNGSGRDVYFNYSGNGGADWFLEAPRLDSDSPGFFNSENPVISIDGAKVNVAWHDDRNGGFDIYYRAIAAGVAGDEEIRINTDQAGFANSLNPVIGFGPEADALVVAWEDGRAEAESGAENGYTDLFYNYTESGLGWQPEDLRVDSLAPGQSYKLEPHVAVFGRKAFYVWTDGRGGTSDVYFQAWPLGEEAVFIEPEDGAATTQAAVARRDTPIPTESEQTVDTPQIAR
jgi:hypothetical protein